MMLVVSVPSELEDVAVALRVRISSGPEDELVERGDQAVRVKEWPAEVFVRASDTTRVMRAELWALNEDGEVVASKSAKGHFIHNRLVTEQISLRAVASDADASDSDASNEDSDVADPGLGGAQDAGMVVMRDDGSTAPPLSRDSGAKDAAISVPPGPNDAGSQVHPPDAGSGGGQTCAATPAYPTKTSCAMCTCTKCASQVAACYASSDSAKNTQCASIQGCAETNHCAGEACYCGTSFTCLLADGACMSVIESAAGAAGDAGVRAAGDDAQNPYGRAKAVGDCELASCKSECGL